MDRASNIEDFAGVCPLSFTPPLRTINREALPEIISSCAVTFSWQDHFRQVLQAFKTA